VSKKKPQKKYLRFLIWGKTKKNSKNKSEFQKVNLFPSPGPKIDNRSFLLILIPKNLKEIQF
jgi:hypothetical protein